MSLAGSDRSWLWETPKFSSSALMLWSVPAQIHLFQRKDRQLWSGMVIETAGNHKAHNDLALILRGSQSMRRKVSLQDRAPGFWVCGNTALKRTHSSCQCSLHSVLLSLESKTCRLSSSYVFIERQGHSWPQISKASLDPGFYDGKICQSYTSSRRRITG